MFWYLYFSDVAICTPMYECKYHNDLCYKAPLCDMGVMLLCCMWLCYRDVMMLYELELGKMIIVNTVMRCVIKLHYAVCCHVVTMFFS